MKIAVPVTGTHIAEHFGDARTIRVFTLDPNGSLTESDIIQGTGKCACRSGIAEVLAGMDVNVLLAGSLGRGAYTLLQRSNIKVFRGCSGDMSVVLDDFLKDRLADNGSSCQNPSHDNSSDSVCHHHH